MARILIVDDDEFDRILGTWLLEDTGHELLYAADGKAALKIYDEDEIDLVITDLVMPEMNGLRLIQEIMDRDANAKVIAISGKSASQLPLAQDLGAVLTLTKPVKRAEIVAAVTSLLAGAALPTDLFG